jgi:hypothetical protein
MGFGSKLIFFILCNTQGLCTEGRFLLLCLIYEHSLNDADVDISTTRLVKVYGVTKTVCTKLTKFLSSSENKIGRIRRNKSRVCEFYDVTLSQLMSNYDGCTQGEQHQQTIIDLLMNYMTKAKSDDNGNEGHLRVSNVLLLIILLVHADKSGAVRGLSKAQIRKFMGGITVDRLNSQLKTLTKKDYILVSSKGGSGRNVFGKVSNNYLLNLGHLQSWKYQTDIKRYAYFRSVFGTLVDTINTLKDIRKLNGKYRNKELKSIAKLLGDDLDAGMSVMNLFLNKFESIVSTLLMERWDVIDTLDVNQCDFLDLPIFKLLLTRTGLFSVSYVEKNTSYETNEKNESDKIHLSNKARKDRYKKEVIVTNQSFQQWLSGELDNDPIILQAHQLTNFLLEQSLAIAKRVKELLVASNKQILEKPEHVNLVFGQVTMDGRIGDRYELLMSLTGAELYDVYSIEASKIDKDEYSHVVSIKRY